jgi:hypothetical protein
MAIAYVTSGKETSGGSTTSRNWTFDAGTGDDRFLLVTAYVGEDPAGKSAAITYNGVSATYLGVSNNVTDRFGVWYLANPASGSNTLNVSASSSMYFHLSAIVYSGVDQTTPINAEQEAYTASDPTPISASLTSTVDDCWHIMVAMGNATQTAGTSTTQRLYFSPNPNQGYYDSNSAKNPAGSVTLNVNAGSTSFSTTWILAIAPATGGGGGGATFTPQVMFFT